jgi:hypothetical protein
MEALFKVKTVLWGYDYIKAQSGVEGGALLAILPRSHLYTIFGFVSSDMSTAQTVCSWQRQR